MKKIIVVLVLCYTAVFSLLAQQSSENKMALVIACSEYDDKLDLSLSNAEHVSHVLTNLGFIVNSYNNLDQLGMINAIQDFKKRIREADTCFVYFSGYTYQTLIDGYILPIDTIIGSEEDLVYKAISLSDIFNLLLEADCKHTFVFMDTASYKSFLEENDEIKELRIPPSAKNIKGVVFLGTIPDAYVKFADLETSPLTKSLLNYFESEQDIRLMYGYIYKEVKDLSNSEQVLQTSMTLIDEYHFILEADKTSEDMIPPIEEKVKSDINAEEVMPDAIKAYDLKENDSKTVTPEKTTFKNGINLLAGGLIMDDGDDEILYASFCYKYYFYKYFYATGKIGYTYEYDSTYSSSITTFKYFQILAGIGVKYLFWNFIEPFAEGYLGIGIGSYEYENSSEDYYDYEQRTGFWAILNLGVSFYITKSLKLGLGGQLSEFPCLFVNFEYMF